jgi:hypothetical protein
MYNCHNDQPAKREQHRIEVRHPVTSGGVYGLQYTIKCPFCDTEQAFTPSDSGFYAHPECPIGGFVVFLNGVGFRYVREYLSYYSRPKAI